MTLLEQYQSGNCEHVWKQIVDEQRAANDSEAIAVAEEMVFRAKGNLRSIYEKLVELGYEFAEPAEAFVTTTPEESKDELDALEADLGALPGLMKIWYSHIHSVNFSQSEAQCKEAGHVMKGLAGCRQRSISR